MQFTLMGFSQVTGFRVFAFQGIAKDYTRTSFTVRANLALIRQHGIQMQELPLMCRGLLERHDGAEQKRTFTFTEEDMRLHAANCAAERDAAKKRRARRIPPTA